jgi:hypothetical protein
VEAVAEGVADYLVGHHPGMPRLGDTQEAVAAAGGLVDALHDGIITAACGFDGVVAAITPVAGDDADTPADWSVTFWTEDERSVRRSRRGPTMRHIA